FAAIFLLVLFIAIVAPLYILFTQTARSPNSLLIRNGASLLYGRYNPCASTKCKQTMTILLGAANQTVDPCKDFYAYACGRWKGHNKDARDHDEDLFAGYLSRIHAKLEEGPIQASATRQERAMMSTYKGCLEFMRSKEFSLSKVTDMLQLDPKTWRNLGTADEVVLRFMIQSFVHGLDLMVRIELSDGVVTVATGQTLTALFGNGTAAAINSTLFELGESDASLISYITIAEQTLNAMTTATTNLPPGESQFTRLSKQWNQTLLRELRKTTAEPIASAIIKTDGAGNFLLMLNALYKESLAVIRLYTLLCLVGPFVKFKYDREHVSKESVQSVRFYCLQAVGQSFPEVLPLWITKNLQRADAARESERMALVITDIATSNSSTLWRFPLLYDDVASLRFHIFGTKNLVPYASEDFPEPNVNERDFVAMTAWVMKNSNKRSKASELPQWRWQLSGSLWLSENRIAVPTSLLGGQYFQLGTDELSINYGTLGVQLAGFILGGALVGGGDGLLLSRDGPDLATVRHCVHGVGEALSLDLTYSEETNMVVFLWAVKVAHEYIETGDNDLHGVQSWLFFMRLCSTFCQKGTEDTRWARLQCNSATFASSSFDRAFNCSRRPTSHCN
ncbi:unnamed protein product, partial [Ixodes hexagonus]